MYVNVIIDNPSSQVDQTFTYNCSFDVLPGMRVKVPFGKGDSINLGIVLSIEENPNPNIIYKDVVEVLDVDPILSSYDLELASFIKNEAICPMSRIFDMMIPSSKRLKQVRYLKIISSFDIDANLLELFNGELIVPYSNKFNGYQNLIKKYIQNKQMKICYDAVEKERKKYDKYLELIDTSYFPKSIKLQEIIDYLRVNDKVLERTLIDDLGVSSYSINKLVDLNVIKRSYKNVSQIKQRLIESKLLEENYLSKDFMSQTLNLTPKLYIPNTSEENDYFIVSLVKENLDVNKTTLIVTPDILQGYYISSLIKKNLDTKLCLLNATINNNELGECFDNIKDNKYNVIVTTPAFILWCYQNIDCVLLLNEESSNYTMDQSPRINMKKVVEKFTQDNSIRLIYQSYAASLETYVGVIKNKIQLLKIDNKPNIDIEIIDMIKSLKNLESNVISNRLNEEIDKTIKNNQKVLLIINNRQYAKSVVCRNCGRTVECPKCHIPLQFNQKKNELKCPICYYKIADINKCHCIKCGGQNFNLDGVGLQQVEDFLTNKGYKVASITTPKFLDFEKVVDQLLSDEKDIVITSMTYSKSLLNLNIGLTAFIDFDAILNQYTFDALVNSYNSLKMASLISNKLMIQTYSPNHFVIKDFILNDYDAFFDQEIKSRKTLKISPIYNVDRILIKAEFKEMYRVADTIKKTIENVVKDAIVIGPSYNFKEAKVQLIIKHTFDKMSNVYKHIYEMYQNGTSLVIFEKNARNFG